MTLSACNGRPKARCASIALTGEVLRTHALWVASETHSRRLGVHFQLWLIAILVNMAVASGLAEDCSAAVSSPSS